MKTLTTLCAAAALSALLVPTASAQITVLGEGPGHACYQAAKSNSPSSRQEHECDQALASYRLVGDDVFATLNNRALVRMKRGDFDGALKDLADAEARNADSPELQLNKSAVLIRLARYDDAISSLDEAIALNGPEMHKAYYNRGVAHEAIKADTDAFLDYREALRLSPDWAPALQAMSRFDVVEAPSG